MRDGGEIEEIEMIKKQYANQARLRRHQRVRKKVAGTAARPRLSVFRSATHIYAQVINDEQGGTLLAASSRDADIANLAKGAASLPAGDEAAAAIKGLTDNRLVRQAWLVGLLIAQRAKAQGIEKVVFDRGGYIYHGRVAALAEGARGGLARRNGSGGAGDNEGDGAKIGFAWSGERARRAIRQNGQSLHRPSGRPR